VDKKKLWKQYISVLFKFACQIIHFQTDIIETTFPDYTISEQHCQIP